MQNNSALVEVSRDAQHFILNGPGVSPNLFLVKNGLKGIFDASVKTFYKSSAFQKGSTYQGKQYLQRDLTFGVSIKGENPADWQDREDDFRSIWVYEKDPWDADATLTKLSITTPSSGKRSLWVALTESVAQEMEQDAHITTASVMPITAVAAQPFWFEDKWEDTPFSYFETGLSGTVEGTLSIANPTPLPMHLEWVVTRGKWTLPDFSWTGKQHQRVPGGTWSNRKITLPLLTDVHGGARIVVRRSDELMIRSFTGTNLIGEMNGIYFQHTIPPFTPETTVPVKVESAPTGGARVEVYCKRRWPRAWGHRA